MGLRRGTAPGRSRGLAAVTRPAAISAPMAFFALFGAAEGARAAEPSPYSLEEAALGGFASTSDYLGVAPTVAFEIGGRRQLPAFSVGIGMRGQYEQYSRSGAGYAFDETLFTVESPITARLGSPVSTILPYVGLAPGALYDRSESAVTTGPRSLASREVEARFSFHAFVGTQLHVGPGGFFFEWGIRVSPVEHREAGDSHLESFTGAIGYRLTL